jgi:hypothetical protein
MEHVRGRQDGQPTRGGDAGTFSGRVMMDGLLADDQHLAAGDRYENAFEDK